jgi:hypothetical protein
MLFIATQDSTKFPKKYMIFEKVYKITIKISAFFEITVLKLLIATQTFRVSWFSAYTFYHCSVNFFGRTKFLVALEMYFERKITKKQQHQHLFLLRVTENKITQKTFF